MASSTVATATSTALSTLKKMSLSKTTFNVGAASSALVYACMDGPRSMEVVGTAAAALAYIHFFDIPQDDDVADFALDFSSVPTMKSRVRVFDISAWNRSFSKYKNCPPSKFFELAFNFTNMSYDCEGYASMAEYKVNGFNLFTIDEESEMTFTALDSSKTYDALTQKRRHRQYVMSKARSDVTEDLQSKYCRKSNLRTINEDGLDCCLVENVGVARLTARTQDDDAKLYSRRLRFQSFKNYRKTLVSSKPKVIAVPVAKKVVVVEEEKPKYQPASNPGKSTYSLDIDMLWDDSDSDDDDDMVMEIDEDPIVAASIVAAEVPLIPVATSSSSSAETSVVVEKKEEDVVSESEEAVVAAEVPIPATTSSEIEIVEAVSVSGVTIAEVPIPASRRSSKRRRRLIASSQAPRRSRRIAGLPVEVVTAHPVTVKILRRSRRIAGLAP